MDRLNEKMELLDEKIQNKAAKAGEDYLSFFESHAEEARESGSPEKVLEYLKKRQNVCLDTLLRQDIAARSTSPMANMAHTLRLECVQQLVEDYGHFIRILADTLRQQETRRDTRTLKEKENRRGPKL